MSEVYRAYMIAGLGFGDEGKGTIVDFLADRFRPGAVVRYNGGPQAAHHVVNDGIMHCFSQFGSGSFTRGTQTFLSRYMLVDPLALELEEKALQEKGFGDVMRYHSIDPNSIIITPFSKIVGQMRELSDGYGSCGRGVGEALRDSRDLKDISIYARDLKDTKGLEQKMRLLWIHKIDHAHQIVDENPGNLPILQRYIRLNDERMYRETMELYQKIVPRMNIKEYEQLPVQIFEGAQGVLLDVRRGFWPHVTKTDITFDNAYALIRPGTEVKRIGVMRAHMTRHGTGPFITEKEDLSRTIPDSHNGYSEWQRNFRIGWPDMVATRYALKSLGGVDSIALTNLDKLSSYTKICIAYEYDTKRMRRGSDDAEYMDIFFDNEKNKSVFTIYDVRKDIPSDPKIRQKLTEILFRCRPQYRGIHNAKITREPHMNFDEASFSDIERYDRYISFLESKDGLSTPVSIISYGPTRDKKTVIKGI